MSQSMAEKRKYRVAGHVFSLSFDEGDDLSASLGNYEPFAAPEAEAELFSVEVVPGIEVSGKESLYISNPEELEQRIDVFSIDGGYLFEMAPTAAAPVSGRLKVNEDFTAASLHALSDKAFCVNNALMLMFAFRTAGMDTIEIHASCVVKDEKGFLFLGKSGTGKSTHSRLWLRNVPGARLLNDDNPVIRIVDGVSRVYGTPWSGKTPCYVARDFPVGAFVRINRAPRNDIHKMDVVEAFAALYSSSSGLRAISGIADGLFATVSSVVQSVPCYVLDCLPDDEAALVCSKEVLGHE